MLLTEINKKISKIKISHDNTLKTYCNKRLFWP